MAWPSPCCCQGRRAQVLSLAFLVDYGCPAARHLPLQCMPRLSFPHAECALSPSFALLLAAEFPSHRSSRTTCSAICAVAACLRLSQQRAPPSAPVCNNGHGFPLRRALGVLNVMPQHAAAAMPSAVSRSPGRASRRRSAQRFCVVVKTHGETPLSRVSRVQ